MNIYYWGCWKQPGHYLRHVSGRSEDDRFCERLLIPSPSQLDATILFLPYPEKVGVGALTYLPGPDRTILAWWGNPWDSRGKVNSAVILEGHATADEVWSAFNEHFPGIAQAMTKPELSSKQPKTGQ